MFKNKYRIVQDSYAGFEVQIRRWWFPVWIQCTGRHSSMVNTHNSLESARNFIEWHKARRETLYETY